jgi:nucleoside phosphorylase
VSAWRAGVSFDPNGPIPPGDPSFLGFGRRIAPILRLVGHPDRAQGTLLLGPRRSGRTSVLWRVQHAIATSSSGEAALRGAKVAMVDLSEARSDPDHAVRLAIESIGKSTGTIMKGVKTLARAVEKALANFYERLVIAVDNFEAVAPYLQRRHQEDIRASVLRQPRACYLIASSESLDECLEHFLERQSNSRDVMPNARFLEPLTLGETESGLAQLALSGLVARKWASFVHDKVGGFVEWVRMAFASLSDLDEETIHAGPDSLSRDGAAALIVSFRNRLAREWTQRAPRLPAKALWALQDLDRLGRCRQDLIDDLRRSGWLRVDHQDYSGALVREAVERNRWLDERLRSFPADPFDRMVLAIDRLNTHAWRLDPAGDDVVRDGRVMQRDAQPFLRRTTDTREAAGALVQALMAVLWDGTGGAGGMPRYLPDFVYDDPRSPVRRLKDWHDAFGSGLAPVMNWPSLGDTCRAVVIPFLEELAASYPWSDPGLGARLLAPGRPQIPPLPSTPRPGALPAPGPDGVFPPFLRGESVGAQIDQAESSSIDEGERSPPSAFDEELRLAVAAPAIPVATQPSEPPSPSTEVLIDTKLSGSRMAFRVLTGRDQGLVDDARADPRREGDPARTRSYLAIARPIITETGYHRSDAELAELEAEAAEMAKTSPLPPPSPVPAPAATWPPTPAPSIATPMSHPPAATQPVDLGIVVALQEEFRELLALSGPYTSHKDDLLTSYRFDRGPYRVVAAFVGDMGESQATRVTERLITLWQPTGIAVVGIAAGMHDDLRVGDVYVPPQAVQYLQDAKASPIKDDPSAFTFTPGPPAYRADHAYLEAVRTLEFDHPTVYRQWRADCCADLLALLTDAPTRERLFGDDLVRRELTLLADGHVATGPVVGAAPAFSAWIRSHDRNVKALEMESAAAMLAAQTRITPKRAFAIRGISDYGDPRKQVLDAIGGGSLRKYAMRNAVRFLWALFDAEALPKAPR